MPRPIKTPCIGVCSTGIGDSVCRGCKRFASEIIHWNGYSNSEKSHVLARLDSLLAQVMVDKVKVVNALKLEAELKHQKVRYEAAASPHNWFLTLLKAGATQITDLSEFGCELQQEWRHRPLNELKDAIDADFYTLSTVHYERYFEGPAKYGPPK